jgi:predicted SAM-dependent methyltransferase
MKLHLGCGKRYLKSYVHIDIADFPHVDYKSQISDLSMFEDNSIEEIYSCHSFEYFDISQAPKVLKEWNRVLKPEGILRTSLPNFDSLIEIYKITGRLSDITGPLFGRWINENSKEPIFHKIVYNKDTFNLALIESGFSEGTDYSAQDFVASIDSEYDDYSLAYFPHMDSSGIQVSLNIIARKK